MGDLEDQPEIFRVRCSIRFLRSIDDQIGTEKATEFMDSFTMDDIMDIYRYEFRQLDRVANSETIRSLRHREELYSRIYVVGRLDEATQVVWLEAIQLDA